MHDPAGRDAEIIRKSLIVDRNLEAATEVICSRTPSQLQFLKQLYHSKFGVYLEHEIELNTSGDHQKVRFLCVNAVYIQHVASLVLVCGFLENSYWCLCVSVSVVYAIFVNVSTSLEKTVS